MKVLFDHQIFYYQYGGASKYFAMLLNAMPRDSWETTALFACNEYVRDKHLFRTLRNRFRGQSVVAEYLNRPYTQYVLTKGEYDIFHQTNFGTYCLKNLGNKPMVTTYHDANLSTIDPHPEIVQRQKISLNRADAVVCVSNNTKNDLLKLFDIDERKVRVIYHGIEISDNSNLTPCRLFSFPYILYVGRRSEYKNFVRLLKAFLLIRIKYPDVHLVCTSQKFSLEEQENFHQLGLDGYIHSILADEQQMKQLYRDALLFVFPSLYEGFGMPILEAWAINCPVALSKASSFPEIAGSAAAFFNPLDVDEIADVLCKIIDDEDFRNELVQKGCDRVRTFSWAKTAEAHMKLYHELL